MAPAWSIFAWMGLLQNSAMFGLELLLGWNEPHPSRMSRKSEEAVGLVDLDRVAVHLHGRALRARLFDELFGFRHVRARPLVATRIHRVRAVRFVAREVRGQDLTRRYRHVRAAIELDEGVAVGRVVDRLSRLQVVEGRDTHVEGEVENRGQR